MKITELIICITVFYLISIVCLESYLSLERNYANTEKIITTSMQIIEFDYKLRTYINNINVPYWKNKKNICELERENILKMELNKNCKILLVNPLENEEKDIVGLSVLWRYGEIEIETRERF